MSKYEWGALVAILTAIFTVPIFAAGSGNDTVEACSPLQLKQISSALGASDFSTDYDAIVAVVNGSPTVRDYPQLVQDVSQVQADWWADVVPTLPPCAIADAIAVAGGRMLDELTISTAIGLSVFDEIDLGYEDNGGDLLIRAQYHISQWTEYQDLLLALLGEVTELMNG